MQNYIYCLAYTPSSLQYMTDSISNTCKTEREIHCTLHANCHFIIEPKHIHECPLVLKPPLSTMSRQTTSNHNTCLHTRKRIKDCSKAPFPPPPSLKKDWLERPVPPIRAAQTSSSRHKTYPYIYYGRSNSSVSFHGHNESIKLSSFQNESIASTALVTDHTRSSMVTIQQITA